jgi:outer membrane protein
MHTSRIALCTAISIGILAGPAFAQDAGDWTLGFGLSYSMPKYDNGDFSNDKLDGDYSTRNLTITASDSLRPSFSAEYFFRDNIGAEVWVGIPFAHTLEIQDFGSDNEISVLPATLSLTYHLQLNSPVSYVFGLGLNYTWATGGEGSGELDGVEFENSWGIAALLGVDYQVNDRNSIRADLRWIDMDNEATLDGETVGEVMIDPAVLSISFIRKF